VKTPVSGMADGTIPVRPGEEIDTIALHTWLRTQVGAALGEPNTPLLITQFPGGHSNLTYLVRCGSHEVVLRRPPKGSRVKGAHDMLREARVLRLLAPHYPAAPRVLAVCDDPNLLGSPFYVMERLRGVILRQPAGPSAVPFPPPLARRASELLIDNLAALHALDVEALGLAEIGHAEGYIERQVQGWSGRWQAARTDEVPDIDAAFAWLADRLSRGLPDRGAALVHNDYKYDNVVYSPDLRAIVGVLDWEMATVGAPLLDLGTTLAYWIDPEDEPALQQIPSGPTAAPGGLRRAELVERYAAKSGREMGEILFAYVFGLLKVAVIAQQIYRRYVEGLTVDPRFARLLAGVQVLGRTTARARAAGRIDDLTR
jgi:aminoglycoside phosphotransferase (APT) family kinase protein